MSSLPQKRAGLPQKRAGISLERLLAQGTVWRPNSVSSFGVSSLGSGAVACFGIPEIDELFPHRGLPFGQLHEWSTDDGLNAKDKGRNHKSWHPPLTLLTSLLGRSFRAQEEGELPDFLNKRLVIWVGRSCWPTPHLLRAATHGTAWNWEKNCLFIDPPDREKRLWALIQALRSSAVFAVVGDVSRLDGVALRRMQLAAEHGSTLGLLMRPPWEQSTLSSTYSKWRVRPFASLSSSLSSSLPGPSERRSKRTKNATLSANCMQWSLELLRLRGSLNKSSKSTTVASSNTAEPQEAEHVLRHWFLAWKTDHGKGSLSLIKTPEAVELAGEDAGAA